MMQSQVCKPTSVTGKKSSLKQMLMKFNSIEEIKKFFDISTDSEEEIRNQLREIIKTIHPDKNGGRFRTKADKKYFYETQEALDYPDKKLNLPGTNQEFTLVTKPFKDPTSPD